MSTISKQVPRIDLTAHIDACLAYETTNGMKPRSIKRIKDYLEHFKQYLITHLVSSLQDISTDFLREYIIRRTEVHNVDGSITTLGFQTVKGVIWSLHTLFGHLSVTGQVDHNSSAPIRYPKEHKQEKLPVYLSDKQLRKLLLWSRDNSQPQDFAIITLMNSTGMRPSDMASLTRFDYDAEQRVIYPIVKGGWKKATPVSDACAKVLDCYLGSRTDSDTALFLNKHNKQVKASYIQRCVKQAGGDADIDIALNCNIMRHTFATHACDRHGKHMTQALLGHFRSRTTDAYVH